MGRERGLPGPGIAEEQPQTGIRDQRRARVQGVSAGRGQDQEESGTEQRLDAGGGQRLIFVARGHDPPR